MEQEHDVQKKNGMGKLSKAKWFLLGCAIILVVLVLCSAFLPQGLTSAVRWLGGNGIASKLLSMGEQQDIQKNNLVEMAVESVGITKTNSQPVVLLKQKDGERYLPIWIGLVEVNAISVVLEKIDVPRPLTPDLLCTIVDKLDADVDRIVITDIKNNIFYAKIMLNASGTKIEIDSRPSDAIAIAIRVKAPIFVTRDVLDKAGLTPDSKKEKYNTVYIERNIRG